MTKHRYLALLWLCPSLGLLYPAPAGAADTLDQSQLWRTDRATVSSSAQQAQIFTAGLYGYLDQVEVYLENYTASPPVGAVLTISVQTVIGGLPSGKQIGSGTIPLYLIPHFQTFFNVSIRGGALVHAGTQYALVLQTNYASSEVYWWYGPSVCPPYAGGQAAFNDGTGWRIGNTEFTFQTYVIQDTVDQSQTVHNQNEVGYTTVAQIFAAGLSGVLDRVSVYLRWNNFLYGNGEVKVSIQTVTGGYPSGKVIGQGADFPKFPTDWGGWATIAINGADVTAGTKYAIVLNGLDFQWWNTINTLASHPAAGPMLCMERSWVNCDQEGRPITAAFYTYVAPPVAFAPSPPPPPTFTPCSSGVCPAVSGSVTPPDSTARVTSNVQFQELPDGTVHGILNFNDSRAGNFVLQGCTTASAACRLTVTTFACTDQHAITVAGTYTPKGETTGDYRLTLSGVRDGTGTFTLSADDYTYTLTRNGIVDVTCPPGAGVVAGQR